MAAASACLNRRLAKPRRMQSKGEVGRLQVLMHPPQGNACGASRSEQLWGFRGKKPCRSMRQSLIRMSGSGWSGARRNGGDTCSTGRRKASGRSKRCLRFSTAGENGRGTFGGERDGRLCIEEALEHLRKTLEFDEVEVILYLRRAIEREGGYYTAIYTFNATPRHFKVVRKIILRARKDAARDACQNTQPSLARFLC